MTGGFNRLRPEDLFLLVFSCGQAATVLLTPSGSNVSGKQDFPRYETQRKEQLGYETTLGSRGWYRPDPRH